MQPDAPCPTRRSLPEAAQVLLWLVFGALTALGIGAFDEPRMARLDLLLFAASLSAFATALIWVALLAVRRGGHWRWLGALVVWIPYVNIVMASAYVRRFWTEDGRRPGQVVMLATLAQLVVSVRVVVAHHAPPI